MEKDDPLNYIGGVMKNVVVLFLCCSASMAIIATKDSIQKLSQRRKLNFAPLIIPELKSYDHQRGVVGTRPKCVDKTPLYLDQQYQEYIQKLRRDLKYLSYDLFAEIQKLGQETEWSQEELRWAKKLETLKFQLADYVKQWNAGKPVLPELTLTKEQLCAHLNKLECLSSQTTDDDYEIRQALYNARFESELKKKEKITSRPPCLII